jgi:lipoprotein NlpI
MPLSSFAQTSNDILRDAATAWKEDDIPKAIELAGKAIDADPKNKRAYIFRATLHEAFPGKDLKTGFSAAIADLDRAAELDPKDAGVFHQRGLIRFKLGQVDASLADFDRCLELHPELRRSHWQRGISCYYAGKYDEGIRQFEGYQEHDANDVENAVWRFMCMVKRDGLPKARKEILKIGDDRRVPMRQIYDLYSGSKTPEDVMAAAQTASSPEAKNQQLFYAHLYLGIWFDLTGERTKALEHLNKAADEHRIGHYMWDVARVHRDRLRTQADKK